MDRQAAGLTVYLAAFERQAGCLPLNAAVCV